MLRKLTVYTVCILAMLIITVWACPVYAAVDSHIAVSIDPSGVPSITVPGAATANAGTYLLSNGKLIAQAIFGLCTMVSICGCIYHIVLFGLSGGNDTAREKAMRGLLFSGIALALLGGVPLIVSFFWNVFS